LFNGDDDHACPGDDEEEEEGIEHDILN